MNTTPSSVVSYPTLGMRGGACSIIWSRISRKIPTSGSLKSDYRGGKPFPFFPLKPGQLRLAGQEVIYVKLSEFEWVIRENATMIAEEICKIPYGWHREVYYDREKDRIYFSTLLSGETYTLNPDKIGIIEALTDIPCDWGVEYCFDCDQYHPVKYQDGEMIMNHDRDAIEDLITILECEIRSEPTAWVRSTLWLD